MSAEILYPVSEVAALWRCSTDHVYELIKRGHIKTVNLARGRAKTRIPESALNAYIATLSRATVPPNPHTPPPPPKPRAVRRMTDPTPQPTRPVGPSPEPNPRAA